MHREILQLWELLGRSYLGMGKRYRVSHLGHELVIMEAISQLVQDRACKKIVK